jgi:heat shock protein HslJ
MLSLEKGSKMTNRRSMILFTAVLVLPLMLLGSSSTPKGGNGGNLENIQWKLTKYSADGALKKVPRAANVYVELKDGRVSGQAVNSYNGFYQTESNGNLTIGKVSSTRMAGPPERQAVENAYFAALQKTASYTAHRATLTLYDAGGVQILVFAKSEVSLVGSWKVTGYNNGKQAVVSVISASTITMDFAKNGAVAGNAGVNHFNAEYTTRGTHGVEIGPPATTKKAGPAELMRQEQDFLAALPASRTYQLRGDTLELRDASSALQVTADRAK